MMAESQNFRCKSKQAEEEDNKQPVSTTTTFPMKPLRLSAFLKEIEEAVNEPLQIIDKKIICDSDDGESSNSDHQSNFVESDVEHNTDAEIKEKKEIGDVNSKNVFHYFTPSVNKAESKSKNTPAYYTDGEIVENEQIGNVKSKIAFQFLTPSANKLESKLKRTPACSTDTKIKEEKGIGNVNSKNEFNFLTPSTNKLESKLKSTPACSTDTEIKEKEEIENVSSKNAFNFLTPSANKFDSKTKYTPALNHLQDHKENKMSTISEETKTPVSQLFSRNRQLTSNLLSVDRRNLHLVSTQERIQKVKKVVRSTCVDETITSMQSISTPVNVGIDENKESAKYAKQLHFSKFVTTTHNFHNNSTVPQNRSITKDERRFQDGVHANTGITPMISRGSRVIPFAVKQPSLTEKPLIINSETKTEVDYVPIKEKSPQKKTKNKENIQEEKIIYTSSPLIQEIEPFQTITVNKVKYLVLDTLGRGGSSVVYLCYDRKTKAQKAIKRVTLTGDKMCVDGYINEVKMLHKLQSCDRIIKMFSYEIKQSEKILYVVLEKGDKDLSHILKNLATNTSHLPFYMLMYYWMEMLYAVKQIHENGIIHSDLKPANFLSAPGGLKLIDFGIASNLSGDMTSVVKNIQIGSFNYISPEALRNNGPDSRHAEFKINFKSDVWSLGCILYQLVYRRTPFQHIGNTYAKLSVILDPLQKIDYPEATWVPSHVITTIKKCLQYNVQFRPSINELITSYENLGFNVSS